MVRLLRTAHGPKEGWAIPTLLAVPIILTTGVATSFGAEPGPRVRIERIDGTGSEGSWIGAKDGGISFRAAAGEETATVDELAAVEFQPEQAAAVAEVQFLLDDGGDFGGAILAERPDAVLARTPLGELELRFDRLAGIRFARPAVFPRAEEQFRGALAQRLPGQDILVSRGEEDVKSLRGRLESLDAARGTFALSATSRTFPIDKVYGIAFAAGAADRAPIPVQVRLTDGSSFGGRLKSSDEKFVRMATSFGKDVELPLERIASLRFESGRVVYLSDLSPVSEHAEGLLHAPWPYRFDLNVAGGPLSISGRVFRKGVGVHSYTALTYELDGTYESLAATIGIDDAVRPRGNVTFRVLGNKEVSGRASALSPSPSEGEGGGEGATSAGRPALRVPLPPISVPQTDSPGGDTTARKENERGPSNPTEQADGAKSAVLFESGTLGGTEPPRDVLIDVRGVRLLTLVVEYGEGLDLSDYADWGAARLIKPSSRAAKSN